MKMNEINVKRGKNKYIKKILLITPKQTISSFTMFKTPTDEV